MPCSLFQVEGAVSVELPCFQTPRNLDTRSSSLQVRAALFQLDPSSAASRTLFYYSPRI